ncbi:MAG: flavodoxin domain-containing protein [Chloroflexota bacterium]|nr:flavodoxin domain-containing protein [Chloroflexota bacterium]
MTLKSLVIYFSPGGNTEKVAGAIVRGLESRGADVELLPLEDVGKEDLYAYDLVCLGAPAYNFTVPHPVGRYVKDQLRRAHARSRVRLRAPALPKVGRCLCYLCRAAHGHS